MKNHNNKIAILISVIFVLLSALSLYTDTIIFDIALPLTIAGVIISYDPRFIGMVLTAATASIGFKTPYDKNDGIAYICSLVIILVIFFNVVEPIFEKYKIHEYIGYITIMSIYFYLIISSTAYLSLIVKSLHSLL